MFWWSLTCNDLKDKVTVRLPFRQKAELFKIYPGSCVLSCETESVSISELWWSTCFYDKRLSVLQKNRRLYCWDGTATDLLCRGALFQDRASLAKILILKIIWKSTLLVDQWEICPEDWRGRSSTVLICFQPLPALHDFYWKKMYSKKLAASIQ